MKYDPIKRKRRRRRRRRTPFRERLQTKREGTGRSKAQVSIMQCETSIRIPRIPYLKNHSPLPRARNGPRMRAHVEIATLAREEFLSSIRGENEPCRKGKTSEILFNVHTMKQINPYPEAGSGKRGKRHALRIGEERNKGRKRKRKELGRDKAR